MGKPDKSRKQHFELSPANRRRLEAYLDAFNRDPERVTPPLKIGDVVNHALDQWLTRRFEGASAGKGGPDA